MSKYLLLHYFATLIKVSILNRRINYKLISISFTGFHICHCCLQYYSIGFDPNDSKKQIPFTHVHTGNTQTAIGSLLYIMSVDYPQLQAAPSSDQTRCVITFPQHTIGSISILDMGIHKQSIFYLSSKDSCTRRIQMCRVKITYISRIWFETIN